MLPYQPLLSRDLPDVISENLSSDACPTAPAVPRSALACFFLRVIGLPQIRSGRLPASTRELDFTRYFFEAASISSIRAERASLPPHVPDLLTVRIQAIDRTGTLTQLDCPNQKYFIPTAANVHRRVEQKDR